MENRSLVSRLIGGPESVELPKCICESHVNWLKFEDLSNRDQQVLSPVRKTEKGVVSPGYKIKENIILPQVPLPHKLSSLAVGVRHELTRVPTIFIVFRIPHMV